MSVATLTVTRQLLFERILAHNYVNLTALKILWFQLVNHSLKLLRALNAPKSLTNIWQIWIRITESWWRNQLNNILSIVRAFRFAIVDWSTKAAGCTNLQEAHRPSKYNCEWFPPFSRGILQSHWISFWSSDCSYENMLPVSDLSMKKSFWLAVRSLTSCLIDSKMNSMNIRVFPRISMNFPILSWLSNWCSMINWFSRKKIKWNSESLLGQGTNGV